MTVQGRGYGLAIAGALACLVLVAGRAEAGIFVCINDAQLEGDSQVEHFEGCIEALSAGESIAVPAQEPSGGQNRERGRPELGDYTIVKQLGHSSPGWRIKAVLGQEIATVSIWFTDMVDGAQREVFRTDLEGSFVTSVSMAADATNGTGVPVEVIMLDFAQITWTLFQYNPDGSSAGQATGTYDKETMSGS